MKTYAYFWAVFGLVASLQAQSVAVKPAPASAPASAPMTAATAGPATSTAPATSTIVIAPKAPALDASVVVSTAASSVTKTKDTLSVDFPDEEIRTVLRNVADLFDLNLVIPDTLQGRTSLKLHDVTWRQIFQVVLSPVGYTFVEDGNIIKIVSQDSLAQEPVTTQVFVLNYAKADDIVKTITPLVETKGGIVVDERSNALVITERPSRMTRIEPIIQQLDKATAQVMIESKFIDVGDSDVLNLGVDWSSLSQVGGTATVTGSALTMPNTTPADSLAGVFTDALPYTATFNSSSLALFLNALQTKTKSRVVSNPTIVTLNNTKATINIGEEYPLPQYTYNTQTGAFAISGFEFKDIGVNLVVTPQVNAAGFIRLELAPEISSLGATVDLGPGGGGANIPQIITKKVMTTVSLADGNTLGIGGLITLSKQSTTKSVPFLGAIPLLGRLFRTDAPQTQNDNLLIFITAKTISATDASVSQVFDPRAIKGAGLKQSDLPGYRSTAPAFLPENAPDPDATK